jgi:dTDP-4-dehydrorhamnose 3,5-epimerase
MMQKFSFHTTEIEGLILVKPFIAYDERGYFIKDYSQEVFEQNEIHHDLKEVFYTNSHKGVVRAIHFQREKQQAKLVRCIWGHVYDVVVDLRKDSKTFGKWQGFDLSEENKDELYLPEGCGHGYLVLEHSVVSYKCGEKFYGEFDDGIMWNDTDIGVNWPLDLVGGVQNVTLADQDQNLQSFAQFKKEYGGF